jgi:hypothetical protein
MVSRHPLKFTNADSFIHFQPSAALFALVGAHPAEYTGKRKIL